MIQKPLSIEILIVAILLIIGIMVMLLKLKADNKVAINWGDEKEVHNTTLN